MSHVLSTAVVAPAQRLAYWVDLICSTYVQLECDAPAGTRFGGRIESRRIPGLDLSVVRSGAQHVQRTAGHIARAADDYFLVSIQARGSGRIVQDGRTALLVPGDFALYDSTREYGLHFDGDFQQFVLKLPAGRLRSRLRDTQKLTATTVSGQAGAGHLMINMIRTLWRDVGALQPASAAAVADGVLDILIAGLQGLPASGGREPSALAAYHLARMRQCVDAHLGEPSFGVAELAAALGLSAAHVHRLFQHEGCTPAQYLWGRRLEACSRELLDPRQARRTIAEVAYRWGFSDAAHFSRAFRERFGLPPREWRRRGGSGPSC